MQTVEIRPDKRYILLCSPEEIEIVARDRETLKEAGIIAAIAVRDGQIVDVDGVKQMLTILEK